MSFLFLSFFWGCIDQAPKGSSQVRQELTFRARNQLLSASNGINNFAASLYYLPMTVSVPIQTELYWVSEKILPPHYTFGFGCLTPPNFYYFEQYTLFSHWEKSVVEDDKNDLSFTHDLSKFD